MNNNSIDDNDDIQQILRFWFEECQPEQWFFKEDAFDATLKERFTLWVEKALAGQIDHWAMNKEGNLALIILLDQMPRNIFRDTPRAFSGDDKALAFSLKGVERGDLDELDDYPRQFLLMPMMHAEDLEVQKKSLPLFKKYTGERTYEFAVKHMVIIERFGHFPHRSPILGRPLSDEEQEFLNGPNSSF
jgi:uncharacterized protein (DUF924 family)